MNLEQSGRNRLAAMKKALAAGLPLAGLLAAAGCSATSPEIAGPTAGSVPCPPPPVQAVPDLVEEEWATEGMLLSPDEELPETAVPKEAASGGTEDEFVLAGDIAIDVPPPPPPAP